MDRLTARVYIIVRRFHGGLGPEGKGERARRKRKGNTNRGWIYGDRVQPVASFRRGHASSLPGERINLPPSI